MSAGMHSQSTEQGTDVPEMDTAGGFSKAEVTDGVRQKMEVSIRPFEQGDWDKYGEEIIAIEMAAFTGKPGGPYSVPHLKSNFTDASGVKLLMFDTEGKVAGYTNTAGRPGADTHYVDNTAFREDVQGQGLIKELMEVLDAELLKNGVTHVTRDARNYMPDSSGRTYGEKIVENALKRGRFVSAYEIEQGYGPQIKIKMTTEDGKGSYTGEIVRMKKNEQ